MKQPKKLSRDQKKIVSELGFNPEEWMCKYEDNRYLHIILKNTKKNIKIIDKSQKILAPSKANQD